LISRLVSLQFFLTFGVLIFLNYFLEIKLLLLARFFPKYGGEVEAFFLALYGAYIFQKMLTSPSRSKVRLRIWTVFSVIFFLQLLVGLIGIESFLQTGKLHWPIPAYIVVGPVFRGGGLFMVFLLLSTIVLVGPAWCSFLCYIGSWDQHLAQIQFRRSRLSFFASLSSFGRGYILLGVIFVALLFNWMQISYFFTIYASLFFIAISLFAFYLSYRKRFMFHCTRFCPIGFLTNLFGRVNPFRMRIDDSCTLCGHCVAKCRYDALNMERVKNKHPSITCTLCADCLEVCDSKSISFYLWSGNKKVEKIFFMLVISLHVVFLGVARI